MRSHFRLKLLVLVITTGLVVAFVLLPAAEQARAEHHSALMPC